MEMSRPVASTVNVKVLTIFPSVASKSCAFIGGSADGPEKWSCTFTGGVLVMENLG